MASVFGKCLYRLGEAVDRYRIKFIKPVSISASDLSKMQQLASGRNGIIFRQKDSWESLHWADGFTIEGSNVVISGSLSGVGSVEMRFPWKFIDNIITMMVLPRSPVAATTIKSILKKYGYDLVHMVK